ncbi:CoA pyrophosphatase [Imbroritus primus]|uniref:CoA pyrophosphatase n=1 Tax=Imbroritus primus TaxID=3058603 RepID=A0ACD3SU84_9BURK|nr:CoA pyrophosphatase [Burkholderiaceae bacterium PBA]
MRPVFDPELLPIVADRSGLPAIPAEQLTATFIRQRMLSPPGWEPELTDESRIYDRSRGLRDAAVLVPIIARTTGLSVMLTMRTAHLTEHAGQISFPGGRCEAVDENAIATALRETNEEIGLDRRFIDILGCLPDYITGTGYHVRPVVGLVSEGFTLSPDPSEVAEIFEVPLAFLMDPQHHEQRIYRWEGGERRFYAMPYPRVSSGRHFIWGATAGMLRNLYHLLAA